MNKRTLNFKLSQYMHTLNDFRLLVLHGKLLYLYDDQWTIGKFSGDFIKPNFFLQLHVHKFAPRAIVCALFARHTCLDETKLLSYVIFPLVVKMLLEDTFDDE